jgi:hypothetical protein
MWTERSRLGPQLPHTDQTCHNIHLREAIFLHITELLTDLLINQLIPQIISLNSQIKHSKFTLKSFRRKLRTRLELLISMTKVALILKNSNSVFLTWIIFLICKLKSNKEISLPKHLITHTKTRSEICLFKKKNSYLIFGQCSILWT